jgi:hypothetical protein
MVPSEVFLLCRQHTLCGLYAASREMRRKADSEVAKSRSIMRVIISCRSLDYRQTGCGVNGLLLPEESKVSASEEELHCEREIQVHRSLLSAVLHKPKPGPAVATEVDTALTLNLNRILCPRLYG